MYKLVILSIVVAAVAADSALKGNLVSGLPGPSYVAASPLGYSAGVYPQYQQYQQYAQYGAYPQYAQYAQYPYSAGYAAYPGYQNLMAPMPLSAYPYGSQVVLQKSAIPASSQQYTALPAAAHGYTAHV